MSGTYVGSPISRLNSEHGQEWADRSVGGRWMKRRGARENPGPSVGVPVGAVIS